MGLRVIAALAFTWAAASSARPDIFHLRNGGTIEGQLLDTRDQTYHVRTVVGAVRLPVDAVERIEPTPTPFEEYERRCDRLVDTPADHCALAAWCEEQDLRTERDLHWNRALELDAAYEPARRALGYVRVGELWVDGRTLARSAEPAVTAESPVLDDPQRLAEAIQHQWNARIRAIKRSLLDASLQRLVDKGRARVLEIRDPLAILPLSDVLSRGKVLCRTLLVEALANFPQDEATLNLAVLALVDPHEGVRDAAISQLVPRNDPRVVAQYREALRSDNDEIVRRAAYGLGRLAANPAVPDLIDVLTAERDRWVEVPVRKYFETLPRIFGGRTDAYMDPSGRLQIAYAPRLGIWSPADQIRNQWEYRRVTVFRTEVLEALRAITGQNFGFERAEWQRWYEEQKS